MYTLRKERVLSRRMLISLAAKATNDSAYMLTLCYTRCIIDIIKRNTSYYCTALHTMLHTTLVHVQP